MSRILALSSALIWFSIGCVTSPGGEATISITGASDVVSSEHVDLVSLDEAARRMPLFTSDERLTTDAADAWRGSTLVFDTAAGEGVTIASQTARVIRTEFGSASASADYRHLHVDIPGDNLNVDLTGIDDIDQRARILGMLAIGLLGGDTGTRELKADFGVSAIIALGIGYATCITGGQALCANSASNLCTNGVDDFAVICGAGWGVDDDFQLGFNCTFRCAQ